MFTVLLLLFSTNPSMISGIISQPRSGLGPMPLGLTKVDVPSPINHPKCGKFSDGTLTLMGVGKFDRSASVQALTHELELIQAYFSEDQLKLVLYPTERNMVHPFWANFWDRFGLGLSDDSHPSTVGTYMDKNLGRVIIVPGLQTAYHHHHPPMGLHFVVGKEDKLFPAAPEETVLLGLRENEAKIVLVNIVDRDQAEDQSLLYALRTILSDGQTKMQLTKVRLRNSSLEETDASYLCMAPNWSGFTVMSTYRSPLFPPKCDKLDVDLGYVYKSKVYFLSYSDKTVYVTNKALLDVDGQKHSVQKLPLNAFMNCTISEPTAPVGTSIIFWIIFFIICCGVCFIYMNEETQ